MKLLTEFYTLLHLTPESSRADILMSWENCTQKTPDIKLFIKGLLDPFYHSMLQSFTHIGQLLEAGFFDDTLEPNTFNCSVSLFTTPIQKILTQIEANKNTQKPFLVILNTGSYSPIHSGHLLMMEKAREVLERDYCVVGGYLSASHDVYVSTKYNGSAALNSEARISLCEEAVSESDWLMCDPWEARYNNIAINFTDVITRLQHYLIKHIACPIEIAYVFGSDNAKFSWAFIDKGVSVCFERPGFKFDDIKEDMSSSRHYFIEHSGNQFSSKAVREGRLDFLPEKLIPIYQKYKQENMMVSHPLYLLRDDREFATQNFSYKPDTLDLFYKNLVDIIQQSFNYHVKIESLCLDEQDAILNHIEVPLINMDCATYSEQQMSISVSRLFNLSDGQVFAQHLIARPGSESLEAQFSLIPPNTYLLVDDDIATGRTVELIKALLPCNISINDTFALSEHHFISKFKQDYLFHDIVDFRDFLIGSHMGGLVATLPNGKVGRVPYVLPYVSLVHRAKIYPSQQKSLSLDIWNINKQFYFDNHILIEDTDIYFQNFAYSLNFKPHDTMLNFCLWHINQLALYF